MKNILQIPRGFEENVKAKNDLKLDLLKKQGIEFDEPEYFLTLDISHVPLPEDVIYPMNLRRVYLTGYGKLFITLEPSLGLDPVIQSGDYSRLQLNYLLSDKETITLVYENYEHDEALEFLQNIGYNSDSITQEEINGLKFKENYYRMFQVYDEENDKWGDTFKDFHPTLWLTPIPETNDNRMYVMKLTTNEGLGLNNSEYEAKIKEIIGGY